MASEGTGDRWAHERAQAQAQAQAQAGAQVTAHALGLLPEAGEYASAARIAFVDHGKKADVWTQSSAAVRILDAMAEADAVLAKDDRANALLAVAYQGLTALVER